MVSGLKKPSATFLFLGTLLWFGCGGKAALESDDDTEARGGNSGRGGQGGVGGQSPIQVHVGECESLCTKATVAGCSAGEAPCVMACATVTGFPNCQAAIQNWLDCAKVAEVVCDASGNPGFPACDLQLTLAAACAVATPPAQAVAESCSGYCAEIETAGCTLVTPVGDCRQACGMAGTALSECQDSYLAWLNCARQSGAVCQPDGQLNSTICAPQQMLWLSCAFSVVGSATAMNGAAGASSWSGLLPPTF